MPKDYYKILEVAPDASALDIKKAFRKAALATHPDRHPDDPQAEKRFKEAYAAYEVLGNTKRREQYDEGGPEAVDSTPRPEGAYPSWENLDDFFSKHMSTDTEFDEFVGASYPSVFVGGEIDDPFTGDNLSSASDIKIAKQDRVYAMFHNVLEGRTTSRRALNNFPRLAKRLLQSGLIEQEEYEKGLKAAEEQLKVLDKIDEIDENPWYEAQEEMDLGNTKRAARIKSEISQGAPNLPGKEHKTPSKRSLQGERGHDPDSRKEMRRETGKGANF